MVEVGSSAGEVHAPLHQGVGLATVLEGNLAGAEAVKLGDEARAIAHADKAKKQAELDDAYNTMLKVNPERWMKHEAIIQPELKGWIDQGAKMMQAGKNPWKSVDPAAMEWRKKMIDIQGLANTSKQMQALWENNRQKLASDPGKYDDNTVKANAAFTDLDPRQIAAQGLTPPPLMQKKPFMNIQKTVATGMADINSRMNGQVITDGDRWKISREFITNPAIGPDLMEAAASAMEQMTPAEKADVVKRATQMGRAPQEVIVKDQIDRFSERGKPFSFQEWFDTGVEQVKVPYKEWKGADTFSKKVDPKEFDQITKTRAQVMLTDPVALQEYEVEFPRDPSWNDGEYKQRAIIDLSKKLKSSVATQEEAGVTASGQGKKDLEDSRKLWLQNIESSDPADHNEALGYLASAPGILPGMTVQNGEIIQSTAGYPELRLFLAGNLEYKDVKKSMMDAGIPVEENQVESRQTNTVITVPITDKTENALLRLHDHAYEDTKMGYKGVYNTNKPDLRAITGPGTPAAPAKTKVRY